ncbi:MAG: hypothetical protein EU547_01275 [Promethearchaeota archaeon]|nr:MAG: hypothetical protein EU547_01275 [Candidatus Lokiarchaeota archaeon]
MDSYWIGILCAIGSGLLSNLGIVLQKKVVNELPSNEHLMRNLVKNKLWITGFLINFAVGTIFYLFAQTLIGPALIPGLMASGLIILAIGSVYILKEMLIYKEIFGIFLMIGGILFLGLSEMSIEIGKQDILEIHFLLRVFIFTLALIIISVIAQFIKNSFDFYKGICLAIFSGNMFGLSNLWVSLLIGTIGKVFGGLFLWRELILFIIASIVLILTNALGVIKMQEAFTMGRASNLVVIQQVPIQTCPIFIYFFVFLLAPPNLSSILLLFISIIFIIISSYLLGKRQVKIERIS